MPSNMQMVSLQALMIPGQSTIGSAMYAMLHGTPSDVHLACRELKLH